MENYVFDYSVCSLFYLGILLYFFIRQKHLLTIRTRIYKVALILTLASVILDITAAITDIYSIHIPIILLKIINSIFLMSSGFIPLIFLIYILALCKYETGKTLFNKRLYIFSPLIVLLVIVIIPFFNTRVGAYYIDPETHRYYAGTLHLLLYIIAGIYFTAGTILILTCPSLKKRIKVSVLSFVVLVVAAMVIQIFMPRYLLNETANCLAMIIIYYEIEQPIIYIDKRVEAFNELGFDEYTFEQFNNKEDFSTIFIHLGSYSLIEEKYGEKEASAIARDLFKKLKANFKYGTIFYCRNDTFCIIMKNTNFIEQSLEKFYEDFSKQYIIKHIHVSTNIKIACINSTVKFEVYDQFHDICDRVYHIFKYENYEKNILLVDEEFINATYKVNQYEEALLEAIKLNSIEVYYQPIISSINQKVSSVEALARLKDPLLGDIPPAIFIPIAEENGLITILGEQIYTKVIEFIAKGSLQKYGVNLVSINFSLSQCLESNVASKFLKIAKEHHVDPSMITFEITEKETRKTMSNFPKTINEFVDNGFKVALDDLGSGYSNFTFLQTLPFSTIKIDSQMLNQAMKNKKNKQRFINIIEFAKNININCICEDVENEEQASFLEELGIKNHQGFLYSHALEENELLNYIKQCNGASKPNKK
ncbi:MAG: EAL domain-containing protein [Bacilli bacterium]